jgi:hypothetical protein
LLPTVSLADAGKVSHALVREVMTRHDATPGNAGLFTVLWEEANILAAHAALAAERPGDLTWMQQHARHVRHTLDPNLEPGGGPGLGYGVIPAARAVLGRMQQLKALPDASSLVKVDADRARIAAENTLTRATELLMLSAKILEATLPEQAAEHLARLRTLADELIYGGQDMRKLFAVDRPHYGISHVRIFLTNTMRLEGIR